LSLFLSHVSRSLPSTLRARKRKRRWLLFATHVTGLAIRTKFVLSTNNLFSLDYLRVNLHPLVACLLYPPEIMGDLTMSRPRTQWKPLKLCLQR
jgi:hypothetical protein